MCSIREKQTEEREIRSAGAAFVSTYFILVFGEGSSSFRRATAVRATGVSLPPAVLPLSALRIVDAAGEIATAVHASLAAGLRRFDNLDGHLRGCPVLTTYVAGSPALRSAGRFFQQSRQRIRVLLLWEPSTSTKRKSLGWLVAMTFRQWVKREQPSRKDVVLFSFTPGPLRALYSS